MGGGMAGGGMGFIFDPSRRAEAQDRLQTVMAETKRELETGVPFAMEPVVYDFSINERGAWADLLADDTALMPPGYYTLAVPALLLLPVALVIVIAGWEFTVLSFSDEEASGALLGSPTLWIFKLMMVVCFGQLLVEAADGKEVPPATPEAGAGHPRDQQEAGDRQGQQGEADGAAVEGEARAEPALQIDEPQVRALLRRIAHFDHGAGPVGADRDSANGVLVPIINARGGGRDQLA